MTLAVVKVLERIISSAVIRHLEANILLHSSQHGNHSGRSVDTNLHESHEQITKLLNTAMPADIILIDISKALNKIGTSNLQTSYL